MSLTITASDLLDNAVHFGHQTRRWNPKMKPFIFAERDDIYIIDVNQTLESIEKVHEYVRKLAADGKKILFVGTKSQAKNTIREAAESVKMPYVSERWLGGFLTNFSTIIKSVARLKELENVDFDDVANSKLTKKELLILSREKDKLDRMFSGVKYMDRLPDAIWIVDTRKEKIAVKEARKLHIPVIAILDTNCDPDVVDYPIPGNDDSIRSIKLLTDVIADAVRSGKVELDEKRAKAKAERDAKKAQAEKEKAEQSKINDVAKAEKSETVKSEAEKASDKESAE